MSRKNNTKDNKDELNKKQQEEITTTKKEEPKKTKKVVLIVIAILIAISLIAIAPIGIKTFKESKVKQQVKIEKIENEIIELEQQKQEEFFDNAFSDKYYDLATEIKEANMELSAAKSGLTIKYTILPIIVIIVIMTIALFTIVIKTMVSGFNSLKPPTHSPFQNHRVQMGQHKVVLDIIDRRLKDEQNKDIKLKPLKCPSCRANVEHEATKCEYCGTSLIKVKK